ncbi:MAG: HD domain-containing protein [Gammaproteobacteria bacterium]
MPSSQKPFQRIAAIDLGSNSFHLVVARLAGGEIRVQERRSEKIQLGAGLDAGQRLTRDVQKRALACLKEYAQRIAGFPPGSVRVVGTNTLRVAKNSEQFVARAEQVLGHPIDIVAGREEARLIYLGVSHTLADDRGKRLVIDIGGGSTECIVGERFEPLLMESLHMGCVSYALKYFPGETISEKQFDAAVTAAHQELLPVRTMFRRAGWKNAVGSSGTVKAIQTVIAACGYEDDGISRGSLHLLRRRVLKARHASDLKLPGLEAQRQGIFVPGLAILTAVFEALDIEHMNYSIGALREGALYDLVGRNGHEDVRDRSIAALMERNHVDTAHAQRVATTALKLFKQVRRRWGLTDDDADLLRRAALAHEVGLDISHSNYQKHGAYLLQHSDLAGFSRQDQKVLAALVRNHRRKLSADLFLELPPELQLRALRTCLLLRLAVILHHGRSEKRLPAVTLRAVGEDRLQLRVPAGWSSSRTLALADLAQEAEYLAFAGYRLDVKPA